MGDNKQQKCPFEYLALHKRISAVKVSTNVDTTVENTHTVKSALNFDTAKKNSVFIETASETPYCKTSYIFSQFWHFL